MRSQKHFSLYLFFGILALVLILLDVLLGSVYIPFRSILDLLSGNEVKEDSWSDILWYLRIPRVVTALLAGAALSISGLLMQTLFRNPIAGPFVLGISSGAGLGVAILLLSSASLLSFLPFNPLSSWSVVMFAVTGSFLVLLLILLVARRVNDIATLLIVGLLIGGATSALIMILEYFGDQESLKRFISWGFGSMGGVTWQELAVLAPVILLALLWSVKLCKGLDLFLIGEDYASSSGMSVMSMRYQVIVVTAVLAGSVTAFCGPIAFIGIAVPHFSRMLFQTHRHIALIPATLVVGVVVMVACDLIAQLPFVALQLPVNAVTSIMGAPVVIWIVMARKTI